MYKNKKQKIECILKIIVFVLIALMLVLQVMAQRGLFADGSYYLLYILIHHGYFVFDEKSRLIGRVVTQTPTVAALWLGVTDLDTLRRLFCGTISAAPVLCWGLALYKTRQSALFWLFLGLFCMVYFNTCFFIVGEYNFSLALSAAALALLIQKDFKLGDKIILFLISAILIMSYASTMFVGPTFALISLHYALMPSRKVAQIYWSALCLLFMISAAVGLWGYVDPGLPVNKNAALNSNAFIHDSQIFLIGTCLLFTGAQLLMKIKKVKYILCFLALCCALACFTGLFQPNPITNYDVRGYIAVAFAGCCIIIALFKFYGPRYLPDLLNPGHFQTGLSIALPVFALFTSLCLWDMINSLAYESYIDSFEQVVNSDTGYLPRERITAVDLNDPIYGWGWTYPTMSLLLRHNTNGAIILNPDDGALQQPYDPITALPDLSRYY